MNSKEIAALRLLLEMAAPEVGYTRGQRLPEVAEGLRLRLGRKRVHKGRAKTEAWLTLYDRLKEG